MHEVLQTRRRGRPPKRHDDKLKTREHLLEVGTSMLAAKGYAAVGLDEILKKAGVPKGSFYHYFSSKEAYVAEIMERYRVFILSWIDRCLGMTHLSWADRIKLFVNEVIEWTVSSGYLHGCLAGKLAQEITTLPTSFRGQLSEIFSQWEQRFSEAFQAAQKAGEISENIDCDRLASFFWFGWEGALQRSKLDMKYDPIEIFAADFFDKIR